MMRCGYVEVLEWRMRYDNLMWKYRGSAVIILESVMQYIRLMTTIHMRLGGNAINLEGHLGFINKFF